MTVRVLEPGVLATVQDLGRPGHADLGVAPSGAADPLSLRVVNRLAGNPDGAPALEVTLGGARLAFEERHVVVVGGAPFAAQVLPANGGLAPLPAWTPAAVEAGSILYLGRGVRGARVYVAVAGGFVVPRVLCSASTHVASGLGGLEGRGLRKGDVLRVGAGDGLRPRVAPPPSTRARLEGEVLRPRLRATAGAHEALFEPESVRRLFGEDLVVTDRTDRMGARLSAPAGGPLRTQPSVRAGETTTEGMPRGAVQVAGDGTPIVLLPDGPTTGGYPVIACVATVDLPALGQLRPRDVVRFERVSVEDARAAFREREAWLAAEVPPP